MTCINQAAKEPRKYFMHIGATFSLWADMHACTYKSGDHTKTLLSPPDPFI